MKVNLSVGRSKIIHGINVKTMTLGKYLEFTQKLEELSVEFLGDIFPDLSIEQINDRLSDFDTNTIIELAKNIFIKSPKRIIDIFAYILEVDKNLLLNNENIGLYEFVEIIQGFIEVNKVGKLLEVIRKGMKVIGLKIMNTGYKG